MSVLIINSGPTTDHVDVVSHDGLTRDVATIAGGGRVHLPPGYTVVPVDYPRPHLSVTGSPIPDDESSN